MMDFVKATLTLFFIFVYHHHPPGTPNFLPFTHAQQLGQPVCAGHPLQRGGGGRQGRAYPRHHRKLEIIIINIKKNLGQAASDVVCSLSGEEVAVRGVCPSLADLNLSVIWHRTKASIPVGHGL